MKAHPVLLFSSSEEEYSSSTRENIRPLIRKNVNAQQKQTELTELSSDPDDIMISPIVNSHEKKVACEKLKRQPYPVKPVKRFNKLSIVLKDYEDDSEYDDYYEKDYENEDETKGDFIQTNSFDQSKCNSNQQISSSNTIVNNLNTPSPDSSPQQIQVQNIFGLSSDVSISNRSETETNSFEFNQIIRNNNNLINQNSFPIYRCHREFSKVMGRSINFKFYRSDRQIMTAMGNGIKYDKIKIFLNDTIISRIQSKSIRSKEVKYDLLKEADGKLEATINFTHKKSNLPREVTITINDPSIGLPYKIESQKPKYNKYKKLWQMNFKGKFVLRSIKNTILVDEDLNKLMYVRKTNKDDIDIDILAQIDEVFIFYFAISSFLCKV